VRFGFPCFPEKVGKRTVAFVEMGLGTRMRGIVGKSVIDQIEDPWRQI